MKFAIHTLGCKVNQYESSALSDLLVSRGYTYTDDSAEADIFIINSCTVTENSDKKAKQSVGHYKRSRPNGIAVLTGCYPQAFPDEAAQSGADIITGAADRGKIPDRIEQFLSEGGKITAVTPQTGSYEEFLSANTGKTRAFVKIEDGCDRFCSYCIIPYARGRVRSRSLNDVNKEIQAQALAGHREVVLLGINLSCYGKDIGLTLADAVETACSADGIERVRLGSLEPELLTPEIIGRLAAQPKLCPHFHLSLQSGCDETLRRMNRHYTSAEYAVIVDNLRKAFPNCAITTDVMVGFAGETDDEFSHSLDFVNKIGFAQIHVFTYSIRKGTAAAGRTDHIPSEIKAVRYKKMVEMGENLRQKFLNSQLETVQKVLIQKRTSKDFANGLTGNYTPVKIYNSSAKKHDFVTVKLKRVENGFYIGEEV